MAPKLDNPKVGAGVALASFGIPVVGPFIGGAYILARVLTDDNTPDAMAVSEQDAEVYITQQFGATCNIECKNIMTDVHQVIEDTKIGGNAGISQTCTTNGTCVISNNADMLANVNFAAKNSTNAKEGNGIWSSQPTVLSSGRQGIKEYFKQISNEDCNITSYQEMRNVTGGAKRSEIGGNLLITQNGSVTGSCQMGNSLKAAAYATGTVDNEAISEGAEGKKSAKMGMMMWLAFAVAFIAVAFIAGKYLSNRGNNQKQQISNIPQVQQSQVRTQPLLPSRNNINSQYIGNSNGERMGVDTRNMSSTVNQNRPLPPTPSTPTSVVNQQSYSDRNSQIPVQVIF